MKGNLIKSLPVIWMIIQSFTGFTQAVTNAPTGSRALALGNTSVAFSDFYSTFNNQAGLAKLKAINTGADWHNRFLVKELAQSSAALALPVRMGVFGASMQYFGYALFNETQLGLAYARNFGEKFAAGLQFDYFTQHIAEGYGNATAFTFEAGVQTRLNDNLMVGAHAFNPVGVTLKGDHEREIPEIFTLGILYIIADGLVASVEAEKNSEFKPLIRGGVEYQLVEPVFFRIGFSTLPARTGSVNFSIANLYAFGFGYRMHNLSVDLAASVHQTLGWSPGISVYYQFSGSK